METAMHSYHKCCCDAQLKVLCRISLGRRTALSLRLGEKEMERRPESHTK